MRCRRTTHADRSLCLEWLQSQSQSQARTQSLRMQCRRTAQLDRSLCQVGFRARARGGLRAADCNAGGRPKLAAVSVVLASSLCWRVLTSTAVRQQAWQVKLRPAFSCLQQGKFRCCQPAGSYRPNYMNSSISSGISSASSWCSEAHLPGCHV